MVLLLDRMYAVKGRHTAPAADVSRRAARRELEGFMRDLAPKLKINSSGDCWRPLPVERMQAAAPPDGVLATHAVDGKVEAYLLRDRVLASDPDANGAQALAFLGLTLTGRLVHGCIGGAAATPAVASQEREIRMEYVPEPGAGGG